MYLFARTAQEIERELNPKREAEARSFALGAVVSSATYLESHINEAFMVAGDPESGGRLHYAQLEQSCREAMMNLWGDVASKLPVLAKYDLVLALNRRQQFDHGDVVYQDADNLVRLRNEIVHYKTGFRDHPAPEPSKLEKRLAGRFEPSAYYRNSPGPLFPHRCLGAGCATWAVRTAAAFADEFHDKLGVRGFYSYLAGVPNLL
jgi:hypothetical protein